METKVLIGLPNTGTFPYQTVNSLVGTRLNVPCEFQFVAHSLIYEARENVVKYAIENDFSHVMFIDSDMVWKQRDIQKLLDYDVDIVSAMAFKRLPPHEPCFYKSCNIINGISHLEFYTDYFARSRGLLEVEGVGMACCMIKTSVFESMRTPYFLPSSHGIGEDLQFCINARMAGHKIFVDTSMYFGHITSAQIVEEHYLRGLQK